MMTGMRGCSRVSCSKVSQPFLTGMFRSSNTRSTDDYLLAAGAVHSNAQPAFVSSGQLAQLDAFDAQADRMRDLVRQLTDAHRTAEAEFLANAGASLASLKGILTASVVVLLALVAAMGWVIYRDMIAPLQTKLVHSQNLLERQEKLVTLGTLQYQTRPGHGTTFGVVLPREINDTAKNANRDANGQSAGLQDKP